MGDLVLKLAQQSLCASYVVLAVIVVRLVLKRSPKWIHCVLWALVAFRLVCPFAPESRLSLVPHSEPLTVSTLTVQASIETPAAGTEEPPVPQAANMPQEASNVPQPPVRRSILPILTAVWFAGMTILLAYSLVSYWRIRRRVAPSVSIGNGVYLCDYIATPFLLGILKPRIYLPSSLPPGSMDYVLAHERAHLRRRDHWWKPFGFLLLSVYWFNPVIWLAYVLLCRDIEMACDEHVIREMGHEDKKAYSEALLSCSVPRHLIAACPLAFGEVGVKRRIKSVLNYKKPGFWIVLVSILACIAVGICFLTQRSSEPEAADAASDQNIGLHGPMEQLLAAYPELKLFDWTEVAQALDTNALTLIDPRKTGSTLLVGCQYNDRYGLACLEQTQYGHYELSAVYTAEDGIPTKDGQVLGFRHTTEDRDLMIYVCWNDKLTAMEWAYGYWDYLLLERCPGLIIVDTANWMEHFFGNEYSFRYDTPIPFTFHVAYDLESVKFLRSGDGQYLTGTDISYCDNLPKPGMFSLTEEEDLLLTQYLTQITDSEITPGHHTSHPRLIATLSLDSGLTETEDREYVLLQYDGSGVDVELVSPGTVAQFAFHIRNHALNEYLESLCDPERIEITITVSSSNVISCAHDYANMEITALENWEYELVPYTNDDTPFGIRGRPKYCDEGWVFLSFWPNGFDIVEEDRYYHEYQVYADTPFSYTASYPSHVAGAGFFYPDGSCWSYLRLNNLPGDYIVLNEGADAWLETHESEVRFHMINMEQLAVGIPRQSEVLEIVKRLDADIDISQIQTSYDWKTGRWTVSTPDSSLPSLTMTIASDGTVVSSAAYPSAG